ncbi:disease resistance protein RGA2-like [Eucalyptus grandis]|uniref:disease resistance protein RGA2-like n=1 Tax=Eucalyptus grandis TaxID=71139 RepID=UPI00192EA472|nr:disease resistance protein RGA2-like [Eucalyptus grandis]
MESVSILQNVVHDADERSVGDLYITRWLCDLTATLYDAEDLLEEWNVKEVTRQRESPSRYEESMQQAITSSSPSKERDSRLEMSALARDFRIGIELIAAKRRFLDLRERTKDVHAERGSRNRERSDSFVHRKEEEEIIGREDAKSAIMKFLLDSDTDEQISVLSIWGEKGIGKTALARCLYEDDMVKKHFHLSIWGNGFRNLEGELRKIRGRETTERADDLFQLQRYLLVIDDLRPEDAEPWGSLKILLMGGVRGSKILITTFHQAVADLTDTTPSYCLEALRTESSVDLLMRMACQEEEETRNPIKVVIGMQIVKKCNEALWKYERLEVHYSSR